MESVEVSGWMSKSFYTRVTIASLLLYCAIFTVVVALFVAGGEPAALIFGVIFVTPIVVAVVLTWKFGPWALIVSAVLALLSIVAHVPFILPLLAYVDSFLDFGVALPLFVTLVVATVASIVASVQHRRDTARTEATRAGKRVLWAITGVVVALMGLSAVLNVFALESVSADEKVGALALEMKNTEFDPARLTVPAGQPAKLLIENSDFSTHTFTIEALGIDVRFVPGTEKIVSLAALSPGEYPYTCVVAGHEEMKGTIVVQ